MILNDLEIFRHASLLRNPFWGQLGCRRRAWRWTLDGATRHRDIPINVASHCLVSFGIYVRRGTGTDTTGDNAIRHCENVASRCRASRPSQVQNATDDNAMWHRNTATRRTTIRSDTAIFRAFIARQYDMTSRYFVWHCCNFASRGRASYRIFAMSRRVVGRLPLGATAAFWLAPTGFRTLLIFKKVFIYLFKLRNWKRPILFKKSAQESTV